MAQIALYDQIVSDRHFVTRQDRLEKMCWRMEINPSWSWKHPNTHLAYALNPTAPALADLPQLGTLEKCSGSYEAANCNVRTQAICKAFRESAKYIHMCIYIYYIYMYEAAVWFNRRVRKFQDICTIWNPPVVSWFVNPINYSYMMLYVSQTI